MTMIIIGICMMEEIRMRKQYGKEYDEYRDKTPFLFPMPRWLKKVIKYPMWLLIRKNRPEKRREVAAVITMYTIILILLSVLIIDLGDKHKFPLTDEGRRAKAIELEKEIENTTMRREIWYKINDLSNYGQAAVEPLIRLLDNEDPNKKEMAAQVLGKLGDTSALKPLYSLLDHPWDNVRSCALGSIVQLGDTNIIPFLIRKAETGSTGFPPCLIYQSLADLQVNKSWDILVQVSEADNPEWDRLCAVKAMSELYPEKTVPYLIPFLGSESKWIKSHATAIAITLQDESLLPYLKPLLDDDYYELRLLAREAIESIEKQ
jgi:HEAT repeat protein